LPRVAELVRRAGSGIIVMPGGGITARNVERIVEAAKPKEIHFGALDSVPSAMEFRRPHVFMGGELRPPEYDRLVTSAASLAVRCRPPKRRAEDRAIAALGRSHRHNVAVSLTGVLDRQASGRCP
jgi:CutC family